MSEAELKRFLELDAKAYKGAVGDYNLKDGERGWKENEEHRRLWWLVLHEMAEEWAKKKLTEGGHAL